ncbi:MAG: Photosynthesis system assembly factor, partial [Fibrobacterota bacterium]
MRLHIFLLAAAGIASDASASDNSWVQLPRIPFGVPVDVEIAGGFVLAGNKVRGDFQGEWKEIDKTNCAFQGRYSLCRGNGIDRAGIDGSRYVDLNGSGEQEEIYGSAEVFRQLKENYNVSDYDLKEYASSGSGSSLFVGDGNVIVFTASYPTVAVLLVALDSVMPNGDAKKFWRLAWAAKKIIDKNEEGDVSLDSIHGPRSIRSISIVRNVIYATGEGALAWRSEDSGRTWMRVPIVPLDGVDQDSDTLMELGGPERLFVSYNNGVAWDTIPFHSDGRVVYREGGIWNYAIRKSGILVRKSADMGVTWTVVASETLELNGYGLSKWTVTKSGELVLLSDDMTTLWYFNLPSSEWETYCLPVVPGPFRKIRKFGSDYIALQNWGANSKLVGYHNGSWSLIRERIQDFEVGDNRVFVIDSGRNFNPFKCEFEQLYISWGDKNWYENCRPVDGDDGNPMTSLWGREVLMTRDLLKWDTALSYRGLEKCQYGYKGQGIYCSSPSDNISLAKDGSYQ